MNPGPRSAPRKPLSAGVFRHDACALSPSFMYKNCLLLLRISVQRLLFVSVAERIIDNILSYTKNYGLGEPLDR